jgi:hypothetical protein
MGYYSGVLLIGCPGGAISIVAPSRIQVHYSYMLISDLSALSGSYGLRDYGP